MYEIELIIPFETLFDTYYDEDDKISELSFYLKDLCNLLKINIEPIDLLNSYANSTHKSGDIHVYYDYDKDSFLMFDLYCSFTSQQNMIRMGVHVPMEKREWVKNIMYLIYNYNISVPKGPFAENTTKLLEEIYTHTAPLLKSRYSRKVIQHRCITKPEHLSSRTRVQIEPDSVVLTV